jgi:uncharacterized metal-binding protein YceD (DUF177 family)
VQGQLRKEPLSFTITTECAHCHQPLHIEIDTELNYRVIEANAEPLVYAPMVNFGELDDPSIIDAF